MGLNTKRKLAAILPRMFEPEGANDVVRLGADAKGGHVIAADAVASTRNLLSLGLQPNFEFELDFAAMAPLKHLHGYDPRISATALRRARWRALAPFSGSRQHRRRAVALYNDYRTLFLNRKKDFVHFSKDVGSADEAMPLDEALAAFKSEPGQVFLKCDIGGGEYELLDAIIEHNDLFSGLALVCNDVPLRLREIQVFLMAMKEFMVLDNMTADNVAGLDGAGIPLCIALSMSSKFRTEPHIPIAGATKRYKVLNEPNDPGKLEIEIFYVD